MIEQPMPEPERDPISPWTLFFAIFVLVLAAVFSRCDPLPARPVHADARLTDQLALARVCASEIGLTGAAEECAAIAEVLRDRADRNGWTFVEAARRYSHRVFDRSRTDARAWVANLEPDGSMPRGWPAEHASWSQFGRERWLALYAAAGAVVRMETVSHCEEPPHFWGMRHGIDSARAHRAGWIEVRCTVPCDTGECPTRNAFWQSPTLLRLDRE